MKNCPSFIGYILASVLLNPFGSEAKQADNLKGQVEASNAFTIYLSRHGEKLKDASNPKDPDLTECGHMRANRLARMLDSVDLKAVYSTDYRRTQNTAKPTAQSKGLKVKSYDPRQLEEFANALQTRSENVLVVGHSNTTNVLAGLLANKQFEQIDESEYDRLYQVTVIKTENNSSSNHPGSIARVQLLHQAFDCK